MPSSTNGVFDRSRAGAAALAALTALLAGCAGADPEGETDLAGDEEVGEVEQALDGRIRYQSSCTPFNVALLERSMQYARTVASTPAFEQCVRNTMAQQYINCADPNKGLPLATQIDRAVQTIRYADNHLTFECSHADGDAWAANQGYGTTGEHGIIIGNANDPEYHDWDGLYLAPGNEFMPWNFRAATMVHEFMHTHDYNHMDPACHAEGACDDNPQCAWTSHCGGSGVPPAGVTSVATAGAAAQQYCSYEKYGVDWAYYYYGEPSLPYIMGSCAGRIVEESHEACGKATAAGACSDWSALRLLTSWTGEESQEQSDSASCGCYEDPRKVVALRTHSGQAVTAVNGGGNQTRTNWGTTTGAWQYFTMIDQDGNGALYEGDGIQLKTHGGQWLQGDYQTSNSTPAVNRIFRASGSGPIRDGAQIKIGNFWHNPATAANEWRYASAGPVLLGATASSSAAQNVFTVEHPRRDTVVRLQASSGYYLRVNGSGGPMMAWSNQLSSTTVAGTPPEQSEGAFWLVDHNGGQLVSGDVVSFEALWGDSYLYLSVAGIGTGQVRTAAGISETSRFVITRVAGPGVIGRADQVTLKSSSGNLLTANLPAAGGQLTNSGTAGSVGSAQRFKFYPVSQHDQLRPTW